MTVLTERLARPFQWAAASPWHTNAALLGFGYGLIWWTRRLIVEYDPAHHYRYGFDGVASMQMLLFLGALLVLYLKPRNVDRFTLPIILAVAILCRLVALFPDPVLSSDVYRYVWDGIVQHAHINPYRYVPGDPALSFLREPNQDIFDSINRRDYARTIYPPVAQMIFAAITFISPTVTCMKLFMVLFEGLTVLALLRLMQHLRIRREWVLMYAWFPMPIWEFAGSGHLDAMVIAFMVFALLFRYRNQPVLTGLFLAFAVLTKFYPLVLFPALYKRGDWKMPATLAALGAISYLPYLSAGRYVLGFLGGYVEEEGIATGTRYYLLEQLQHLPGFAGFSNTLYMLLAAAVFAALIVWCWRSACPSEAPPASFLWPAFALALALMLLFSPHYPWYVAWLIPFLVLRPSLTVLTYVGGLFYLCTTALAAGYGPKQFLLNQILYSSVAVALIIELSLGRLPISRRWLAARAREAASPDAATALREVRI